MKGGWRSFFTKKTRKSSSLNKDSKFLINQNDQHNPNPKPNNGNSKFRRATRKIRTFATKSIGKIRSKIRRFADKLTMKFKPKNYKQYLIDLLYTDKIPYTYVQDEIKTVKSIADVEKLYTKAKEQMECDINGYIINSTIYKNIINFSDFSELKNNYIENKIMPEIDRYKHLVTPNQTHNNVVNYL